VSCKCRSHSASAQKGLGLFPWLGSHREHTASSLPLGPYTPLLTTNSDCNIPNVPGHRSRGPEKKKKSYAEKVDCSHWNSSSFWLTEGPPGTCCGLNNSPLGLNHLIIKQLCNSPVYLQPPDHTHILHVEKAKCFMLLGLQPALEAEKVEPPKHSPLTSLFQIKWAVQY